MARSWLEPADGAQDVLTQQVLGSVGSTVAGGTHELFMLTGDVAVGGDVHRPAAGEFAGAPESVEDIEHHAVGASFDQCAMKSAVGDGPLLTDVATRLGADRCGGEAVVGGHNAALPLEITTLDSVAEHDRLQQGSGVGKRLPAFVTGRWHGEAAIGMTLGEPISTEPGERLPDHRQAHPEAIRDALGAQGRSRRVVTAEDLLE